MSSKKNTQNNSKNSFNKINIIIFVYIAIVIFSLLSVAHYIVDTTHFDDRYLTKVQSVGSTFDIPYSNNISVLDSVRCNDYHAVIKVDTELNTDFVRNNTYAALLVNNETDEFIVAHNVHRRVYPASMTKLMTAMVVCDAVASGQISLDDEITLQSKVVFNESGVMESGIEKGCTITVRSLMYGLLIKSYNDYAVILAEYVGGSIEGFAELMNKKAISIGATNSHFMNPHGLHDDDHYISIYDMYLIINAASKYDFINEIDSYKNFSYSYVNAQKETVRVDVTPTNAFLAERVELPSNISIKTWKTGTTHMAGYCLSMIVTIDGCDYTIVVCDSESSEDLYETISKMFNLTK